MADNADPQNNNQDQGQQGGQAGAGQGDAGQGSTSDSKLESKLNSVLTQASDWKKKAEAAQAELDKINAAKQAEADKKLAEQGEHEKIIAEREKRIAELEHDSALKDRELLITEATAKLATDAEGKPLVGSASARRAMAADWAAKTPEERAVDGAWEAFVEAQKKADPLAFAAARQAGGSAPRVPGPGGNSGGSEDWTQVRKDYDSGNPTLVAKANAKVLAFGKANGQYPPGFEDFAG